MGIFLVKQLFPFRRKSDGRLSRATRGCEILFVLGKSAVETILMLKTVYGHAALSKTRVYEWFSRFKNGKMSIEDQPRSGRPQRQDVTKTSTKSNC